MRERGRGGRRIRGASVGGTSGQGRTEPGPKNKCFCWGNCAKPATRRGHCGCGPLFPRSVHGEAFRVRRFSKARPGRSRHKLERSRPTLSPCLRNGEKSSSGAPIGLGSLVVPYAHGAHWADEEGTEAEGWRRRAPQKEEERGTTTLWQVGPETGPGLGNICGVCSVGRPTKSGGRCGASGKHPLFRRSSAPGAPPAWRRAAAPEPLQGCAASDGVRCDPAGDTARRRAAALPAPGTMIVSADPPQTS